MEIILTAHAAERMEKRGFLKEEILSSISFPDRILKKHGKHIYQKSLEKGKLEIVCEQTEKHIKVITVYWI